jgi:hypothetical protein
LALSESMPVPPESSAAPLPWRSKKSSPLPPRAMSPPPISKKRSLPWPPSAVSAPSKAENGEPR